MSSGMGLDGDGGLEIGPSGQGVFRKRVETLAEFKAVVAYLAPPGTVMYEQGKPHKLRLVDSEPSQPATFPAVVAFPVVESELPEGSARELMILTSPTLGGPALRIEVVEYGAPTKGGVGGHLVVQCDTGEVRRAVAGYLSDPEGGILMSQDGGVWRLRRMSDDADHDQRFPRAVRFEVSAALA